MFQANPRRAGGPRPRLDTTVMVPTARLRPIVGRWLAGFETPEEAYQELEAGSPYSATTWRNRLTFEHTTERGWWRWLELDELDVDDFLTAAGLTELWHTELRDLFPTSAAPITAEEYDATCIVCSRWIDWSRGDRGVRVEMARPHRWRQWWSVCSLCLAHEYPASGFGKFSRQQLLDLYVRYVRDEIGVFALASSRWEELGYRNLRSCGSAISQGWTRNGWPMRSRSETKHLNAKRRGPRETPTKRIPVADLRKMHALHVGRGVSINAMSKQLHAKYGFASASVMGSQVSRAWKILGLTARDRIEMTVLASTTNGCSPRDWATRKARRKAAGLTGKGKERRVCTATSRRTGLRCTRPALLGVDVCQSHDPERQAGIAARLAEMRKRSPLHDPARLEPIGPLQQEMRAYFERTGRSWFELAAATGRRRDWLSCLSTTRQQQQISRAVAAEIRTAIAELATPLAAAA